MHRKNQGRAGLGRMGTVVALSTALLAGGVSAQDWQQDDQQRQQRDGRGNGDWQQQQPRDGRGGNNAGNNAGYEQQSPWAYALSQSEPMRFSDMSRFNVLSNRNPGFPRVEGDRLVLIPEERSTSSAAIFLNNQPVRAPFAVQFDYQTYNQDGGGPWDTGDGVVLMFGRRPLSRRDVLPTGGGRAFVTDGSGYGVHVALYGEERGLILTDGSGRALASRRNPAVYTHDRWANLRVEVETDGIRVYLNGALQIDWRGQVNTSFTGLGIGAATGDANALHAIRDLRLAREPRTPPRPPPGPAPGPPPGPQQPYPSPEAPDGELIINGDFEQPSLRRGSVQMFGDLPGWRRSNGRTIEVQNNVAGSAAKGNQFVELDGEDNTTIYQDVETRAGADYELRLAFSPRPGTDARDNGLEVVWNGQVLTRLEGTGQKLNDTSWTYVTLRVRADDQDARLELRDVGRSSGVGTYVDDVSLKRMGGRGGGRR